MFDALLRFGVSFGHQQSRLLECLLYHNWIAIPPGEGEAGDRVETSGGMQVGQIGHVLLTKDNGEMTPLVVENRTSLPIYILSCPACKFQ